jgi:hypothetical protein
MQMAALNVAGGNSGLQLGVINIAGSSKGDASQFGILNVSGNPDTFTLGLINVVKDGIMHLAAYTDDTGFFNVSFRSGSRHYYTILSAGSPKVVFNNFSFSLSEDPADEIGVGRIGWGYEMGDSNGGLYLDFDITAGALVDLTTFQEKKNDLAAIAGGADVGDRFDSWRASSSFVLQLRAIAGIQLFDFAGAFVGVSYDYYRLLSPSSPNPAKAYPNGKYDWGGVISDRGDEWNVHRIGVFAGVQM